jgi:putative flippase GtrA
VLKSNTDFRYIVNGIIATLLHYSVLYINIEIIELKSIGIANFIAAIFGIIMSFLGNKFFVFTYSKGKFSNQIIFFMLLYFTIAFMHGVLLYIWSDLYHMDYRIGFVIATILQALLSYTGNKKIVFK